jgi:hypothetical protein
MLFPNTVLRYARAACRKNVSCTTLYTNSVSNETNVYETRVLKKPPFSSRHTQATVLHAHARAVPESIARPPPQGTILDKSCETYAPDPPSWHLHPRCFAFGVRCQSQRRDTCPSHFVTKQSMTQRARNAVTPFQETSTLHPGHVVTMQMHRRPQQVACVAEAKTARLARTPRSGAQPLQPVRLTTHPRCVTRQHGQCV